MNESNFESYQAQSRTFLKIATQMDRQESMENPNGYGKLTGACGDTVEFF